MEIRAYTEYNEAEILGLYASVGWTAYTDDPAALRNGFANSLLTLAAYEEAVREKYRFFSFGDAMFLR